MTARILPSATHHGMPATARPPMTRARLIALAKAGSRVARLHRAPNIAAICNAFLLVLAENDRLRRELAAAQGWHDEPTRRQEQPSQDALAARCAARTGTIDIPEYNHDRRHP